MAQPLTAAQVAVVTQACTAARIAARTLTTTTPSVQWLAVLATLNAAIAGIPGADAVHIQDTAIGSFLNLTRKRNYYHSLTVPAVQAERDANTPVRSNLVDCDATTLPLRYNLFLSCSEFTDPGQPNSWHCVTVVRRGMYYTILSSEADLPAGQAQVRKNALRMHRTTVMGIHDYVAGAISARRVRLAYRPTLANQPALQQANQQDCVRFALHHLIDIVERVLLGHPTPLTFANLTYIPIVP